MFYNIFSTKKNLNLDLGQTVYYKKTKNIRGFYVEQLPIWFELFSKN